ncbi:hypothetical protein [Algivirga pacifica]|uniref:Lipoprotein n=1 Tax=Algivirga pacifica TaxID=1162670 RepID=A0ABP9DES9_9BACT
MRLLYCLLLSGIYLVSCSQLPKKSQTQEPIIMTEAKPFVSQMIEKDTVYYNSSFSFKTTFPTILQQETLSDNTEGAEFTDGTAHLVLWGSLGTTTDVQNLFEKVSSKTLEQYSIIPSKYSWQPELKKLYFQEALLSEIRQDSILYHQATPLFFVLSGYTSEKNVFYQRTEQFMNYYVSFKLTYPLTSKVHYDSLVDQIKLEPYLPTP